MTGPCTGAFEVGGSKAMIMFGMVTDGAGGTGTLIGTGCGTWTKEIGGVTGAGVGHTGTGQPQSIGFASDSMKNWK